MDERSGVNVSHGYASYRIRIQNRSTHETHRIKVRLEDTYPSRPNSNVGRIKGISKTIEAAPNSTVETYIHQPYLPLVGDIHGPAVWIDGKRAGGEEDILVTAMAMYIALSLQPLITRSKRPALLSP